MTSTVLVDTQFVRLNAENVQLALPGQAQSATAKLGLIISGNAPQTVPTVGVIAHAGGGQASATPVSGGMIRVDTVVTAADSIQLPLAVAGLELCLVNNTANSMQVFGAGTDTINNVATATGVAQGSQVAAYYVCSNSAPAGKWHRIQSS